MVGRCFSVSMSGELEPLWFVLRFNKFDVNVGCMISKFTDGKKICGVLNSDKGKSKASTEYRSDEKLGGVLGNGI